MHVTRTRMLAALAAATLAFSAAAFADPPGQVGRLNFVQGSASVRTEDSDDWTTAVVNYPLTTGDSLWVDRRGRAEVHLASAVLRMGPDTEITFLALEDSSVQLALLHGNLSLRLRDLDEEESFEVDTPTMSVRLDREGSFRVDVDDDGSTRAVAREGRAEVVVDSLSYPLREGQAASAAASGPLAVEIRRAGGEDEWDRWCADRDRREEGLAATRYVPRLMIGWQDLDWYGTWDDTPEYGLVWVPSSVPAGWAPYRFGRWAWVKPWGWTWIDDEPWGFAPFHYGRWAHRHGRWVWVPGTPGHRPVYAPALVVFIDAGPGTVVIHGDVGWFPLGPREPYYPWYDASPQYIQKVNLMHVRVDGGRKDDPAHQRYVNRSNLKAVTVVRGDAFRQSRKVTESRIEIPEKELSGMSAGGAKAPPAPDRQGLKPSLQGGTVAKPPAREKVQVKIAPPRQQLKPQAQPEPQLKPAAPQPREEPKLKPASPQPREEPKLKPAPQQPKVEPQVKPSPQKPKEEPGLKPAAPQKQEQPQVQKGSEKQKTQPARKMRKVRKQKLVNGQWIWVEEWEPVEEEKD